jgi:signal transduction histidine kinase
MAIHTKSLATHNEQMIRSQRTSTVLWGILSLIIFLASLYAAVLTIGLYSLGFTFDFTTRTVLDVESTSLNYGRIQEGDEILTIEDVDLYFVRPLYLDKVAGDILSISIVREGTVIQIPVVVESPSTHLLVSRVAHLLTGIAFCLLGILGYLRTPAQKFSVPFLLMCLCATCIMVALDLRAYRFPTPLLYLYYTALALFGATFVHVHTLFPIARGRFWQVVVRITYGIAIVVAIAFLSFGYDIIAPSIASIGAGFVLLTMVVGLYLLLTSWRRGDGATRRKLRLLVFATFVPILVTAIVILLGELNQGNAPYDFAYFGLIAWPLAYAYSMHKEDIRTADRIVYRVILNALLVISLAVLFLTLAWLAGLLFPTVGTTPVAGSVISVFLAFVFTPVRSAIEGVVNRAYYGTSYDYLQVLNPSIQKLSTLREESVTEVVTNSIPQVLNVSVSDIWRFQSSTWIPITDAFNKESIDRIIMSDRWKQYISERRQAPFLVSPYDNLMSDNVTPRWAVPLWIHSELVGIWFLGARKHDDLFAPVDERLIEVIASTTALVLRARYLLHENTEHAQQIQLDQEELSRAYQQLTQARDDERLHLSRELHDSGLQLLAAVKSKLRLLSQIDQRDVEEVSGLVMQTIQVLRGICHGLRPTALTHGLQSGLQGLIREVKENFGITVEIRGQVPSKLPEPIETNVYRIVQEALVNVAKHADTQQAELNISASGTNLQIDVIDHGTGFTPKQRTGFGILGQRERTHALNGTIAIESIEGKGTKVSINIPLAP